MIRISYSDLKNKLCAGIGSLLVLLLIPTFSNYLLSTGSPVITNEGEKEIEILVNGKNPEDLDLKRDSYRIYVRKDKREQRGARLILTVVGLKPNTKVYWSYKNKKGPLNSEVIPFLNPFSACSGFSFDQKTNSTVSDERGEAKVLFTSTTYAGDSFQFGAGLKFYISNYLLFQKADIKTKSFVVWKRIYLEQPKVLKNVQFPSRTIRWVSSNLARMNIEVSFSDDAVGLDPLHPVITHLFKGNAIDKRYGPQEIWGLETPLKEISQHCTDGDSKTINIIILGALSKKSDLIKDSGSSLSKPPHPVDYSYHYKKDEIDPEEFLSYGSAVAIAGDCPSIIVWADYWWILSRRIKVSHAKVMARAILHELGHFLLNFKTGQEGEILDLRGHLSESVYPKRSMMNGYNLVQISRGGKLNFSSPSIDIEKKFIRKPTWHPKVQRLIRRDFNPLKQ